MATLGLNPPARLGAHLLAQQRIPHAARASAVEGVADLSPVFEQSALSAASESPRVLRRLNTLRGLSHEQVEQVLTRGA